MNDERTRLTNAMWSRLSPLLPGQESSPGTTAKDTRLFVEAVLWRARTGAAWRDLPPRFGPWNTAYRRFHRWAKDGVWPAVLKELQAMARLDERTSGEFDVLLLDSTSAKAHSAASGAKKKSATTPRRSAEAGPA